MRKGRSASSTGGRPNCGAGFPTSPTGRNSRERPRSPSPSRASAAACLSLWHRPPMTDHKALTSTRHLEGLSVLVVEDETMVALLIEDMLLELGCRQVRHASGVEMAMTSLREQRPDFAMLDVNLNRELVFPVAAWLQEARIPFIFATGYGGPTLPQPPPPQPLLTTP